MSQRTTEKLYDEKYYKHKYKTWIDGGLNLNNPRIKIETEKKINFIERYVKDAETILVGGCSFGFLVMMLRDKGHKAFGIDVAEYAIKNAPLKVKPFLKLMNMKKIEYPDNHFNLVALFDVMEHLYLEEIEQAIKEINRVANKYILIRVPIPYYDAEIGISDFSQHPSLHHAGHVSMYSWDFWARRFSKLNKFEFWFAYLWGRPDEDCCETWITFRRK